MRHRPPYFLVILLFIAGFFLIGVGASGYPEAEPIRITSSPDPLVLRGP